jgi:hypothetical protein
MSKENPGKVKQKILGIRVLVVGEYPGKVKQPILCISVLVVGIWVLTSGYQGPRRQGPGQGIAGVSGVVRASRVQFQLQGRKGMQAEFFCRQLQENKFKSKRRKTKFKTKFKSKGTAEAETGRSRQHREAKMKAKFKSIQFQFQVKSRKRTHDFKFQFESRKRGGQRTPVKETGRTRQHREANMQAQLGFCLLRGFARRCIERVLGFRWTAKGRLPKRCAFRIAAFDAIDVAKEDIELKKKAQC